MLIKLKNWYKKLVGRPTVEDIKVMSVPNPVYNDSEVQVVEVLPAKTFHMEWKDGAYRKVVDHS